MTSLMLRRPLNAARLCYCEVDELVTDAVSGGAKVVVGGKRHARGGLFYEPTLLTNVRPTMKCASNEIFGPVAPIIK